VAESKDSQEICFIAGDYRDFLQGKLQFNPGLVYSIWFLLTNFRLSFGKWLKRFCHLFTDILHYHISVALKNYSQTYPQKSPPSAGYDKTRKVIGNSKIPLTEQVFCCILVVEQLFAMCKGKVKACL
jgi:hypothetical protein